MNAVQLASAGCLAVSLAALAASALLAISSGCDAANRNIDVNSNTKVNVDNHYHGGGFDVGSYRPVATGVAIGATPPDAGGRLTDGD